MSDFGAEGVDRLVLDTSAYWHLRVGDERTLDMVASARSVVLPVVVLGELEAAFRMGSRERENRVALREFSSEEFVTVADTTRPVAVRYGEVFAQLRRAGTPIPVHDIWIAATTLEVGGHLLTFDHDFRHVADLAVTILDPA